MAGTANSITSHNSLRGVLNTNNVIAGGVGTAFDSTYSIIAETGAQIALSISSTDYKMQATLKDKYGNIIYTSNIIDLPLETMVVNARYDKNTKEVVLILDNGNELRFSVADLVEGLVSTDQLNSALTDYVKFTDYAGVNKGGVVKKNESNNFDVNANGYPLAMVSTYEEYLSKSTNAFISKGTLENVITGKELVNKTYVDEADAVFEDKLFGDDSVEGSGTELTIDNTTEAPMNLIYKGNTYQDSTTGKNLMDSEWVDRTLNGVTITNNGDGTYTLNGTSTSSTAFSLQSITGGSATHTLIEKIANNVGKYITISTGYSANQNFYLQLNLSKQGGGGEQYGFVSAVRSYTNKLISSNESDVVYMNFFIGINANATFNNVKVYPMITIQDSQITTAPTPSDFEQYTGGIASPNPNYPQDIHVVSGDNSIEVVGKNIFDKDNINSLVAYIDGNGKIANAVGNYLIWMKVTQNTNYAFKMTQIALSTSSYVDDVQIGLYETIPVLNATGTRVYSQARSSATEDYTYTTTFNSGTNNYIAIKIANTSRTDATATLNTLQLEKGTQATTYEEYKGASYPISLGDIELCKIGTYQDKIDKSTGKNLLDISDITNITGLTNNNNTSITLNGIPASTSWTLSKPFTLKANTTYTLSLTNYIDNQSSTDRFLLRNGSTNIITIYFKGGNVSYTPTQDTTIDTLRLYTTGGYTFSNYTFSIMLNEGTTALPYEPYGTGWYLKKEIGKVVLNGSENWKLYTGTCYYISLSNAKIGYQTSKCSHFTNVNLAFDSGIVGRYCDHPTLTSKYFVSNSSSVEDFKTWLSNNHTILYYVLAIPTYEEITDEILVDQLEAIKLSYNEQTNINQTNNDLPFELNISAISGNLSGIKLLLEAKEDKSNKVTTIDENSTDTQYPTAKCMYDIVGDVESLLEILDIGTGAQEGAE